MRYMAGHVLIVDGDACGRILLRSGLQVGRYVPQVSGDAAAALRLTRDDPPQAVIVDLDSLPDGLGLIDALAGERADLPVLALGTGRAVQMAALRAGAHAALGKPMVADLLLARLRALIRRGGDLAGLTPGGAGLAEASELFLPAPSQRPVDLAVIGAEPALLDRLRTLPVADGALRLRPVTAAAALAEAAGAQADLYLVADQGQTGTGPGLRLVADLRARLATATCVLMRAPTGPAADALAYDLGADEVMDLRFDPAEAALRLAALIRRKRLNDCLSLAVRDGLRHAVTDSLTGLHNRHYALHRLATMEAEAARQGTALSVLVADIDRFKLVNDRWGHAAGDAVLVAVAAQIRGVLRDGDLLARFGGEEFLIALPGLDLPEARQTAERVVRMVRDLSVRMPGGDDISVSLSVGLATRERTTRVQGAAAVAGLIDQADRAMMGAKTAGRGRVMVCLDVA